MKTAWGRYLAPAPSGGAGVNVLANSTSPIRLSAVAGGAQVADAVQAGHAAFGLDPAEVFARGSPYLVA